MNYLDKILDYKRGEISHLDKNKLKSKVESLSTSLRPCFDFYSALKRQSKQNPLNLIAELKKASPSKGVIVEDFQPLKIAKSYADLGASAFSVLTDEHFFQGGNTYLEQVRKEFNAPILRKDFIISESQIYEARLIGADAILLIVAALDINTLKAFLKLSEDLGMHALVEIHSEDELEKALDAKAKIVGINNRNLKTFEVNLETSCRIKTRYPKDVVSVSESGIKTLADLKLLEANGFDAVLIGEGLVTSPELQSYNWKG